MFPELTNQKIEKGDNRKLKNILLVDDDFTSTVLSKSIINKLNITESIQVLDNGEDAFQYVKESCLSKKCPELILLDLNMPILNGFEFIEAYQLLNSYNSKIVLAVLTSSSFERDFEAVKSLGVDDYIIKPLTSQKLLNLLEKHSDKLKECD